MHRHSVDRDTAPCPAENAPKPLQRCGIVAPVKSKALGTARNQAVRDYVRGIIAEDFKGNATAAARAFNVSQPMIFDFLAERRGAGMKLIDGVAAYRGVTIDVVMGRAGDLRIDAGAMASDPCPNRARAVAIMRGASTFMDEPETWEQAIKDIEALKRPVEGDRPITWWLLTISSHYELLCAQ